ncbi:MAG: DUF3987 domain-containing protein [Phycisphaerae bacterium]|nr:DUF3987 domain-containing protein [Phycisphaerae bacterium]
MRNLDPVQTVLAKLDGVRQTGRAQWQAHCPAHDDKHASLSIGRGDDGRALVRCHAGCALDDVLVKIGLKDADLFTPSVAPRPLASPVPKTQKGRTIYKTAEEAFATAGVQANGQFVSAWQYPGDTFRVGRFALADGGKTFRPIHRNAAGWSIGDPAGPLPLYRGDDLPDSGAIIVCEGEKCVEVARGVGLPAVTSAHGAGSAHKSDWRALAGREVVILPDNDDAGRGYAQEVATILNKLTPPATVKIIDLPGLSEHGDIADWIDPDGPMGSKTADEIRSAVMELARAAAPCSPSPIGGKAATPIEPYRPFPVKALPEPLRSFVAKAADAIGCDAAFVALPLLAASASAIGNTRRIELKRGWTEPAILWASIVGDSGTLKSPALELSLRPLRKRQHDAMKEHAPAMEEHKAQVLRYEIDLAAWKKSGGEGPPPAEPQAPILPRYWCDDTTIEALAVLLLENWRGLLLVRDELAGWLGGFDRYTRGSGAEVSRWVEMHGGRSITVDRKTGNPRTIYVPRAAMSVAGGIQPAMLQRALGREYFENGLAARLLLACPPRRVKQWTDAEIDPATEKAVAIMFDRLYSLEPVVGQDGEPEPGIVRLSPEAKRAWVDFYNEHAQEHVDLTGDLSAAWSKLEGYAARLALVVHFVRWAAGDTTLAGFDVVDEASIAAGVALSRWFGQETRRVYAILEETDVDRQRRGLVELIQRRGGAVTARDLMRSSRAYPTSETAEYALNGLVQAGLGRWVDAGPTEQGGRPTRRSVLADAVDVDTTPKTPRE